MPWRQQTAAAWRSSAHMKVPRLLTALAGSQRAGSLQQLWACCTLLLDFCTAANTVLHAKRVCQEKGNLQYCIWPPPCRLILPVLWPASSH